MIVVALSLLLCSVVSCQEDTRPDLSKEVKDFTASFINDINATGLLDLFDFTMMNTTEIYMAFFNAVVLAHDAVNVSLTNEPHQVAEAAANVSSFMTPKSWMTVYSNTVAKELERVGVLTMENVDQMAQEYADIVVATAQYTLKEGKPETRVYTDSAAFVIFLQKNKAFQAGKTPVVTFQLELYIAAGII